LHARGWHTLAAEQAPVPDNLADANHTYCEEGNPDFSVGVRFWLVDRNSVYPLKTGLNTIGRSPENDVVLQDAYVSRRHCAILVHAGDGCEVHDTASKNGTFLNGRKLAGPSRLQSGDEIRMCDCQLIFMSKAGEEPPSHSPTQVA
jgi:pSer/pThr/pTyr-binding forkhead associated (FHA) protein